MSKKINFWMLESPWTSGGPQPVAAWGYYFSERGYNFVVHHPMVRGQHRQNTSHTSGWTVSELTTGLAVINKSEPTIQQAMQSFHDTLDKSDRWQQLPGLIAQNVAKHAMPPWEVISNTGPRLNERIDA
jgi:hypothetical protein